MVTFWQDTEIVVLRKVFVNCCYHKRLPIPGERHSLISDVLSFRIVTKSDVQRVPAIRAKIVREFSTNMFDYQAML